MQFFVEEDDKTHLVEDVPAVRLRPRLKDDSKLIPIPERNCGKLQC